MAQIKTIMSELQRTRAINTTLLEACKIAKPFVTSWVQDKLEEAIKQAEEVK